MKFLIFALIIFSKLVAAQEGPSIIAVGDADIDRDRIYFTAPTTKGVASNQQRSEAGEMVALLRNDFSFYKKKFEVIAQSREHDDAADKSNWDFFKGRGTKYLVKTQVSFSGKGFELAGTLVSITDGKELGKLKNFVRDGSRADAHELADLIYQKITGKKSIFKTKITFVSDVGATRGRWVKDLYMMDFDGKSVKRLTNGEGTVISPAMSYDQKKIVYSMIKNHSNGRGRNVDLYILDLVTGEKSVISSKHGINSGAIFTPDGNYLLLTQSYSGSADIYELNLATRAERKITKHYAADVDPSINADGTLMTFLSDRAGKAMVYTANPRSVESNVNRISFVGQFNATPRFSPDGKKIAFASWVDNTFDIYRINSEGQGLVRLTKDFGSNEDPTFSNDGEFILFSSQRVLSRSKAVQNLYIMDADGEIITAVTEGFGNCISPRWSN